MTGLAATVPPHAPDPDHLAAEANECQRGASDPTTSVWVAASAGTGKTKVLTDRVLRLLLAGCEPGRILALTFTRVAAADMKLRMTGELAAWAAVEDQQLHDRLFRLLGRRPEPEQLRHARALFARVLDDPTGLNVQTIHGFCQSVLARFPLEATIPPDFQLIEGEAQAALNSAARRHLLSQGPDNPEITDALTWMSTNVHELTFDKILDEVIEQRHRVRRFLTICGGVQPAIAAVRAGLGLQPDATRERLLDRACCDKAFDAARLRRAATALAVSDKPSDAKISAALEPWLDANAEDRKQQFFDYCRAFLVDDKTGGNDLKVRNTLGTRVAARTCPDISEILRTEADRLLAAGLTLRAIETAEATAALLAIATALIDHYERLKANRGALDFDDLIERTATLLMAEGGVSWVMYKLDGGLDHVLIDEAQDTSPAQWEVITSLVSDFFAGDAGGERGRDPANPGRTVFGVGDFKQSIYSFQGASPEAFLDARDGFVKRAQAARRPLRPIDLSVSFRSTRAVLEVINAVFKQPAAKAGVVEGDHWVEHQSFRLRAGGSVELWPLVVEQEAPPPEPWATPTPTPGVARAEEQVCALVAERIRSMIVDKELLPSAGRPIHAGDVMVLVRRRGRIMEELVRQLKRRQVPVAGMDRMVLKDQLAVMDLIAAGRFALLPTDDLTLACVLKSPLIGLTEEQLFALAHDRDGRLWTALRAKANDDPKLRAAAERLSEVLAWADRMPPFEFYARILGPLEGRSRLLARLGPDAEDPIAEFMTLALRYDRDHAPSLEGFLHQVERTDMEIKRDLDQSTASAVRVMTIHGAKGLQAPIVILPDTTYAHSPTPSVVWSGSGPGGDAPLWAPGVTTGGAAVKAAKESLRAAERREANRLLYVAMTRAEDRLVVCGWRQTKPKEHEDCWYHLVRRAIEGLSGHEETTASGALAMTVADGSPLLRYSCPQKGPAKTEAASAAWDDPGPLPDWALSPAEPEAPVSSPLAPSRPVATDNESAMGGDAGHSRFQRGILIHRLLEVLPGIPAAAQRERAERFLGQSAHGLDDAATTDILDTVLALLSDPSVGALFGPNSRPEVAVAGTVAGVRIEGRVDRLVIDASAHTATVVDFKTERDPPRSAERVPTPYLRQMAAYAAVLANVSPGLTVRCGLLWTSGPTLMMLPEEVLAAHHPGVSTPRRAAADRTIR